MKRMELHITIVFAIMFVVGVIINGLYSVISMKSNFFTFEVMAKGLMAALVYLGYVWMRTRKHQLLTMIGVLGLCSMGLLISFSSEGVAGSFSDWNWSSTVMFVYYVIAFQIAGYQSEKLLEEDKETLNINLHITGDIKPEDNEVTVD